MKDIEVDRTWYATEILTLKGYYLIVTETAEERDAATAHYLSELPDVRTRLVGTIDGEGLDDCLNRLHAGDWAYSAF